MSGVNRDRLHVNCALSINSTDRRGRPIGRRVTVSVSRRPQLSHHCSWLARGRIISVIRSFPPQSGGSQNPGPLLRNCCGSARPFLQTRSGSFSPKRRNLNRRILGNSRQCQILHSSAIVRADDRLNARLERRATIGPLVATTRVRTQAYFPAIATVAGPACIGVNGRAANGRAADRFPLQHLRFIQ